MQEDTAARIAAIEARLSNVATCADTVRLQEQVVALSSVVTKYVDLKSFHNAQVEDRVRKVEEQMAAVQVQMAIVGIIGAAALSGVIAMLFRMFEGVVK